MSAFASRQQLWGALAARSSSAPAVEKATPEQTPKSETPDERAPAETQSTEDGKGESGPSTPRPESSAVPVRQHSSFKPSKKNLQTKPGGRLVLTTPEAERLVILGSYGVKVREGEATIAGAILTPSDDIQWVHAPHCHAVPVLRTADDTVLELQPHPAVKGLRQLANLNPAFAKLWNKSPESKSKAPGTFQIIYTSQDVPKKAILQELASPAEWNKKLSGLAAKKRKGTPVIFLCGPKSSGKSTLGRLLANRLMTDRGGSKHNPWSNILVLDIDPGQPEYSPPGVISLTKITTPNLSPSFCHPTLTPAEGQLRAHAIASVSPALDPAHFIECVLDLFNYYQRSPDAKSPLIVNTPGWIQGTGLDILTELITSIRPTEVIYMSQDGPDDTVSTLQSACNAAAAAAAAPIPFSTLPSQPGENSSSRTSLHFRAMQTMSYFHLQQTSPLHTWDPRPLTAIRPWRVRYAGQNRGFLGILCYDHQPAPELLSDAINGTVLALVKISRAALRDLLPLGADSELLDAGNPPWPNNNGAADSIPLIANPQGRTLSPSHSHVLGLVLVRGIDTARRELQVLTPLSLGSDVAGEELVLVAGRFDTPTWAYTEDLYLRGSKVEDGHGGNSNLDEAEEEVPQEEVPWVEVLHGSEKRAVGSKVWRVRRDLGKN